MLDKPDIVIIGIGNPHRYDDGVGFFVIDELKDSKLQNVEMVKVQPDGYSLLEIWNGRKLAIIIDAAKGIGPVGTVKYFDGLMERIPSNLSPVSSHSLSLPETISLGETLNQLPDKLVIFAIEASDLGYGMELSKKVKEAGIRVSEKIKNMIEVAQGTEENTVVRNNLPKV